MDQDHKATSQRHQRIPLRMAHSTFPFPRHVLRARQADVLYSKLQLRARPSIRHLGTFPYPQLWHPSPSRSSSVRRGRFRCVKDAQGEPRPLRRRGLHQRRHQQGVMWHPRRDRPHANRMCNPNDLQLLTWPVEVAAFDRVTGVVVRFYRPALQLARCKHLITIYRHEH